jgi:hypothetical protein
MGIFDNFFGSEPEMKQVSTLNPQQQGLQRQDIRNTRQMQGGYRNAMGLLEDYLNPESDVYKNFEQPYLNQFNQQTIPQLAERFGGANAMGSGLQTSGFGQSLGSAGANLQTQLAQMKEQYRRQSIGDLLQQYNQATNRGLQQTQENVYQPGTEGWGTPLLKAGLKAAGTAIGGPFGGMAANTLSNFFSPSPGGMQANNNMSRNVQDAAFSFGS